MRRFGNFATGLFVGIALILAVGFSAFSVHSQDDPTPVSPIWLPFIQMAATSVPTPTTILDGDYIGATSTGGEFGFHVFSDGMLATWGWFDTDCDVDSNMDQPGAAQTCDLGAAMVARDKEGNFAIIDDICVMNCYNTSSSEFYCYVGFGSGGCSEGTATRQ